MLLTATSLSAQCIKGTVTDAATGESIPFIKVLLQRDGETIKNVVTDFDGVYTMKYVDSGLYDIVAMPSDGYNTTRKSGVWVKSTGFTVCNIKMEQGETWKEVQIEDTPILEIGVPEEEAAEDISGSE